VLRSIKSELSLTLVGRVEIYYFISEKTHKSNALRLWVIMWRQSNLCGCTMPNVSIQSSEAPPLTA
jgi:hypothetical protein